MGDAGGAPPSGWYDSGGRLVNMIWTSRQFRNDSERQNGPGGKEACTPGKGQGDGQD